MQDVKHPTLVRAHLDITQERTHEYLFIDLLVYVPFNALA